MTQHFRFDIKNIKRVYFLWWHVSAHYVQDSDVNMPDSCVNMHDSCVEVQDNNADMQVASLFGEFDFCTGGMTH